MSYTVSIRHVDTCLPAYVTDHHNRPGELLIGVPVSRATRVYQVRQNLADELRLVDFERCPLSNGEMKAAIADLFAGAHPLKAFDRNLDAPSFADDGADDCSAWFLITWQPAEGEAPAPAAPAPALQPTPCQPQQARHVPGFTVGQFRRAVRNGPFAWPGGYPCRFICDDGESLCHACAKTNRRPILESLAHDIRDGWRVIGFEIYYEGPAETCANCNGTIESAYGDPDQAEPAPMQPTPCQPQQARHVPPMGLAPSLASLHPAAAAAFARVPAPAGTSAGFVTAGGMFACRATGYTVESLDGPRAWFTVEVRDLSNGGEDCPRLFGELISYDRMVAYIGRLANLAEYRLERRHLLAETADAARDGDTSKLFTLRMLMGACRRDHSDTLRRFGLDTPEPAPAPAPAPAADGLTFETWRATREWCEDLGEHYVCRDIGESIWQGAGYIYTWLSNTSYCAPLWCMAQISYENGQYLVDRAHPAGIASYQTIEAAEHALWATWGDDIASDKLHPCQSRPWQLGPYLRPSSPPAPAPRPAWQAPRAIELCSHIDMSLA